MLHYVTKSGICGVEIAEADQAEVEEQMAAVVRNLATKMSVRNVVPIDKIDVDGSLTRIWNLRGGQTDLDVGLLAFKPPQIEPEFVLTMARARSPKTSP